ncbi:MAG: sigma 54-interacting transcriptional regulator [Terriglobales bacterium]
MLPRAFILSTWVAGDPNSMRLVQQIARIAESSSTVLVRGECGVGKNHIAQLLHFLGPNADEPLVTLECAALPAELLEGELFGQEAEAFSQLKRGRLEVAGSGTLVLDEVAALSMPMQAKLLRVLDEKRYERLGGTHALTTEARILALTSVDLEHAVARRSFREDLYFRLNVIPIFVPPLRERVADIRLLAEHFLQQLTAVHRKPEMAFSSAALAVLQAYGYPGNVRELRNVVEHSVLSATPPEILLENLPAHMRHLGGAAKVISLEQLERRHIAEVLGFTHGKKTQAAQILGISRKTLLEKRKRYGLE